MKVAIIGCGNIGAGYDLNKDAFLTHAKAFFTHKYVRLFFSDINQDLVQKIANKYNGETLNEITAESLRGFSIVSICTPTITHWSFLKAAIDAQVPVIICEKPVVATLAEIELCKKLILNESVILVNYMRRFLPAFKELKRRIEEIRKTDDIIHVTVRYQKGFVNNASHAIDLISFLLSSIPKLENVQVTNTDYDHFESDPTLSLSATWNDFRLNLCGLSYVKFAIFEIDFFFRHSMISIKNSGNTVERFALQSNGKTTGPLIKDEAFTMTDCLKDYMLPVAEEAVHLVHRKQRETNFIHSLVINELMLQIINETNG